MQFHVPGNPLPKQSFKKSKKGGYTPQRIKNWEQEVAWKSRLAVHHCLEHTEPWTSDLTCELVFVRGDRRWVDCENLSKPVTDAMNGIVYEDDHQIVDLRIRKFYSKEEPGLTVKVYPVENIGGSENE
ncbi:MAG: RusA family crossover junction endodeoxyribonuclease [Planctomycetota bacterium]